MTGLLKIPCKSANTGFNLFVDLFSFN